jgi:hypothetical protein
MFVVTLRAVRKQECKSGGVDPLFTSLYCISHWLETFEPNSSPFEGYGFVDCDAVHFVLSYEAL